MARLPKVEIQAHAHPRFGWVLIPVRLDGRHSIEMVANFGVPRSSISAATRHELIMHELIPPRTERTYVLAPLTVQGQPLPPLNVRVSRMLGMIGASGILGLDFFAQYEDVHFHVPTFRLTLNGP